MSRQRKKIHTPLLCLTNWIDTSSIVGELNKHSKCLHIEKKKFSVFFHRCLNTKRTRFRISSMTLQNDYQKLAFNPLKLFWQDIKKNHNVNPNSSPGIMPADRNEVANSGYITRLTFMYRWLLSMSNNICRWPLAPFIYNRGFSGSLDHRRQSMLRIEVLFTLDFNGEYLVVFHRCENVD